MEGFEVFQKFIPILFFVIWIFSAVVKLGKRTTPSAGSKSITGSSGTPRKATFFDELRKTLSAAMDEMKDAPPFAEEGKEPVPAPAHDTYVRSDETLEQRINDEMVTASVRVSPKRPTVISQPAQLQHLRSLSAGSASNSSLSREKLREGILLSEILSPPVALRESSN